jgi:ADP-heptose:LPS heptosyltransferase
MLPAVKARPLAADLRLPATLLARYLFFLGRRPISRSNRHYLAQRLAGLQSLAPLLRGRGEPVLDEAAAELERLNPASFGHRAARLEALLASRLTREPAPDVLISASPPGAELLAPVRRAVVILGPGIGVGDEVLCFAVARWLRARLPGADLTVLTAYRGLWDRVPEIDRALPYESYADLVAAIRGNREGSGRPDLVMMIDFEKPDLANAVTEEPGIARYVEISLGAASATAFSGEAGDDAAGRWLHRYEPAGPPLRNYYASLDRILAWLAGGEESPESRTARAFLAGRRRAPGPGRRTVLVTPFTSKHEPSLVYWSRLLAQLVPEGAGSSLRFVFDPGPNLATERFAAGLAAATRQAAPAGLEVEVARGAAEGGRRTLSLAEILARMEEADVVVASDSFAAHAAPFLGAATLVLAQPGLVDWRVPAPGSFYFEDSQPLAGIAAAMRQALAALGVIETGGARPWAPPASHRLLEASRRLAAALAGTMETAEGDDVCGLYDELARSLHGAASGFERWPRELDSLLADRPYGSLLPPLPASGMSSRNGRGADLRLNVRSRFEDWENSNLRKYLGLLEGEAG